MAVRYEPNVDEYNRAPAGRKFRFPGLGGAPAQLDRGPGDGAVS
jgi:hypothetical protein